MIVIAAPVPQTGGPKVQRWWDALLEISRMGARALWQVLSGGNGAVAQIVALGSIGAALLVAGVVLGGEWRRRLLVRRRLPGLRQAWAFERVEGHFDDGVRLSLTGRTTGANLLRPRETPGELTLVTETVTPASFTLLVHPTATTSIPNRWVDDPAIDARIDAHGDLRGLMRVLDTHKGREALRELLVHVPSVYVEVEAGRLRATSDVHGGLDDFLRDEARIADVHGALRAIRALQALLDDDARAAGVARESMPVWRRLWRRVRGVLPFLAAVGAYAALIIGIAKGRVGFGWYYLLVLGAPLLVVIAGGVWSLLPRRVVRDAAVRALEDAWSTPARRLGDAVWLDTVRDGFPVHVELATNQRGLLRRLVPFFLVRTRTRGQFQLSAEGYAQAVPRAFGIQDIVTGDTVFDDAAHLRGDERSTLAYFAAVDVRAAALALLRDELVDSVSLDTQGDLRVKTRIRLAPDDTEAALAQKLAATVQRSTALARALDAAGDVPLDHLPQPAGAALGGGDGPVAVPALTTTPR